MKIPAILISFLSFMKLSAQCYTNPPVFEPGEVMKFDVYYNLSFVWVHAGEVKFQVAQSVYQKRPAYYFDVTGNSIPAYDWLFKVRDRFQAYMDKETLQPLWFQRNAYEDGFTAYEVDFFNYTKNKIFTYAETSQHPLKRDTVKMKTCIYDIINASYSMRNIDFSKYKINDTIPIKILIEIEVFPLYIRFRGRENMTLKNNQTFRCLKFSVLLVAGTMFKGGEDITVWVTDDNNHVPVYIESKILIGSVKVLLSGYDHLKFPLNSEINTEKTK